MMANACNSDSGPAVKRSGPSRYGTGSETISGAVVVIAGGIPYKREYAWTAVSNTSGRVLIVSKGSRQLQPQSTWR